MRFGRKKTRLHWNPVEAQSVPEPINEIPPKQQVVFNFGKSLNPLGRVIAFIEWIIYGETRID